MENFRPGAMERLGYGWETLSAQYPRLIYAAASGFGHNGPYKSRPAYDMVVQGMGGIMSITGQPGGPPTRVGASVGDLTAGLFTTIGISSALHHRAESGKGMKIDVAMLDCQVAILENALSRYFPQRQVAGAAGRAASLDRALRRLQDRRRPHHHRLRHRCPLSQILRRHRAPRP